MPPKAKQIPHAMTVHGDTRLDNYYWLRDDTRSQPDVLEYLQAENEYGRCIMASQQALQDSPEYLFDQYQCQHPALPA